MRWQARGPRPWPGPRSSARRAGLLPSACVSPRPREGPVHRTRLQEKSYGLSAESLP